MFSTKNHKQAIMQWANERLSNYPYIKDISFYGLMLCALLNSYAPEKINYFSLNPKDSKTNIELAEKVMNELNIHVFVDSEEIFKYDNKVDETTLLTQLSTAKNANIRSYIEHELHLPIMNVQCHHKPSNKFRSKRKYQRNVSKQ